MARLSEEITSIPQPVLKLLQQQNVNTVLDFLQEDIEKLSSLCSLSFKEIVDIRQQLICKFSAAPQTGLQLFKKCMENSSTIYSGIKSLDSILNGGLLTGNIYEICGSSGDGKTQLCLTLAANISYQLKQDVHYIDTKGDFSAHRLSEVLLCKGITSEDCKTAMNYVKVTKPKDFHQLITFICQLQELLTEKNKNVAKLVIIDSLPAIYFPFMGDHHTEGLGLLNHLMSAIRSLATEHNIVFVLVNLSTTYSEAEDTTEDQTKKSDVKPFLGKYWRHAVDTRLLLQRVPATPDEIRIQITKSSYLSVGKECIVKLQQCGIY